MRDLDERFRSLGRVDPPDLWSEILEREPRGPIPAPRSRRGVVIAVALAVALLGLAGMARMFLGPVGSDRTVVGEDESSIRPRVSATIGVGEFPTAIAVDGEAVWVVHDGGLRGECTGELTRIDPGTNTVADSYPLDVFPQDVTVLEGSVWISGGGCPGGRYDGVLVEVDPDTGVVLQQVGIGRHAGNLTNDGESIWALREWEPFNGEVLRVDPSTGRVLSRTKIGGWPRDIVIGGGSVWVYVLSEASGAEVGGASVYRFDAETGDVIDTYLRGEGPASAGVDWPNNLAFADGAVWSVRSDPPATYVPVRIDAITGEVEDVAVEGTSAIPFAAVDGLLALGGPDVSFFEISSGRTLASVRIGEPWVDAAADPTRGAIWVAAFERSVFRVDLNRPEQAGPGERSPSRAGAGASQAPRFAPAEGWHSIGTDPIVLDPEGFPLTWTSTIPFAEEDLAYFAWRCASTSAHRTRPRRRSAGPRNSSTGWRRHPRPEAPDPARKPEEPSSAQPPPFESAMHGPCRSRSTFPSRPPDTRSEPSRSRTRRRSPS